MKLSIIIPCYNAEPYIYELLDKLEPQLNDDIEVLLVDDGSKVPVKTDKKRIKVIRKENGGVSSARNMGLDLCCGEYVSFIDADDLVSPDYVQKILQKVPFDILEMSWKSLPGGPYYCIKLNSDKDRLINPSVCTRAFRREVIGDTRFNLNKDSAEDEDFLRHVVTKNEYFITVQTDFLYFYRTNVENSGSKKQLKGECKTRRILYYYPIIRAGMTSLIDEVKKEDETNEVIIMTYKNELPELRKYASVRTPAPINANELRGEPFNGFKKIPDKKTIKTQVVIYTKKVEKVGGITTWIYNFCRNMAEYYDITVLYEESYDLEQAAKLRKFVPVFQNRANVEIFCDTLIIQSIFDTIPQNISFGKSIQMVHACSQLNWKVPQDRDLIVNVSDYSKSTWREECLNSEVIHNLMWKESMKALFLVSATRIAAPDKGMNDYRMKKLLLKLEESKRPYIWFNFSNIGLSGAPERFINMPATTDIQPYIANADYLVQLSDPVESFGYSSMEALTLGTPIITTYQPALEELGYVDGVHGHTVPDDMEFDVNILWDIPKVKFTYSNKAAIKKWREILGNTKPTHSYNYDDSPVQVKVITDYHDIELNKLLHKGAILEMRRERAEHVQDNGYVMILEG